MVGLLGLGFFVAYLDLDIDMNAWGMRMIIRMWNRALGRAIEPGEGVLFIGRKPEWRA